MQRRKGVVARRKCFTTPNEPAAGAEIGRMSKAIEGLLIKRI